MVIFQPCDCQWIGLRENIEETPSIFPVPSLVNIQKNLWKITIFNGDSSTLSTGFKRADSSLGYCLYTNLFHNQVWCGIRYELQFFWWYSTGAGLKYNAGSDQWCFPQGEPDEKGWGPWFHRTSRCGYTLVPGKTWKVPLSRLKINSIRSTNRHGTEMGLSENSVPLHPMVNDHYPY